MPPLKSSDRCRHLRSCIQWRTIMTQCQKSGPSWCSRRRLRIWRTTSSLRKRRGAWRQGSTLIRWRVRTPWGTALPSRNHTASAFTSTTSPSRTRSSPVRGRTLVRCSRKGTDGIRLLTLLYPSPKSGASSRPKRCAPRSTKRIAFSRRKAARPKTWRTYRSPLTPLLATATWSGCGQRTSTAHCPSWANTRGRSLTPRNLIRNWTSCPRWTSGRSMIQSPPPSSTVGTAPSILSSYQCRPPVRNLSACKWSLGSCT